MKKSGLRRDQARVAWLFSAPALVLISLFILLPFLMSLVYSFTDKMLVMRPGREVGFVGLENFVKVFTSLDTYTGSGVFDAWIRKIFVNGALEYLRRGDVLREASDWDSITEPVESFSASAVSELSAAELMKLVQELPAGFRTVFNLFAIEGYSHREIAEMMNITESTSRSQYTRARQLLQKRVKELFR